MLIIIPCFTPLLPINVSYTIQGTGKVYPKQEWVLTRDVEGGIVSTLFNHELGIISEVSSYKFERGDIANVRFTPFNGSSMRTVSRGDTIGSVQSYLLEERLNTLRLQLQVEKARLRSESAGEKGPIIAEARQRLEYAQEQYKLSKINFDRTKALYRDAVIPEADFNQAENEFRLAEIQIKIAESSLQGAEMGRKPELLQFILTTMRSIENELAFLETKRTGYAIVAPISGNVDYTVVENQVMSVDDTTSLVMTVPIQLNQQAHVKIGTPIEVQIPGQEERLSGEVVGINGEVQILESKQVLFVKAAFKDQNNLVRKGMLVACEFQCDSVSLWKYFNRVIGQWSK